MRVRPIALLSALSFALAGQLALAADDAYDKVLKQLACSEKWTGCLSICGGQTFDQVRVCHDRCTFDYVQCIVEINKSLRLGEQPPAEVRTGAGLCLDVHAPQIAANGGRVQAWACNGQPQQLWTYDPAKRAVRNAGGLCLDVHAPQMKTNGGRVQVWTCNAAPQQQWTLFKNGALRNAGGLCLDVHAADQTKNGARIQVWQCNGAQQQRFTFATVPGPTAVRPGQTPPLSTN